MHESRWEIFVKFVLKSKARKNDKNGKTLYGSKFEFQKRENIKKKGIVVFCSYTKQQQISIHYIQYYNTFYESLAIAQNV